MSRVKNFGLECVTMAWIGLAAAIACRGLSGCSHIEAAPPEGTTTLSGLVFDDANGNGVRDEREKGLARVRVSNGREVVLTDARGRWFLSARPDDTIFVIKPRHWMLPVDDNGLPQFYYVHNPAGSPQSLRFPGVEATPQSPPSIDFPLRVREEDNPYRVILLGDPQSRNLQEVEWLSRDVMASLVGTDADFGLGLGDLAFDDLAILEPHNEVVGRIGIPWFNVHGNHDMNYDVAGDAQADETWQRIYGPATYSFDWGSAHFIVLDDVIYDGDRKYHGGFTPDVLQFVEADLVHIGKQTLIVLLMHIPLTDTDNADDLLRLIADRPNTLSVSAHTHWQGHRFMDFPADTGRTDKHHHLINATACGSWWRGAPDERGIPHATMRCGGPNGHTELKIDHFNYDLRFIPAGSDGDEQMHVILPGSIMASQLGRTKVIANVWAGSSRSTVRMRVDDGPWVPMTQTPGQDPLYQQLVLAEAAQGATRGMKMSDPANTDHLWTGTLPTGVSPGGHALEVESTDQFGVVDTSYRIFRVLKDSAPPGASDS